MLRAVQLTAVLFLLLGAHASGVSCADRVMQLVGEMQAVALSPMAPQMAHELCVKVEKRALKVTVSIESSLTYEVMRAIAAVPSVWLVAEAAVEMKESWRFLQEQPAEDLAGGIPALTSEEKPTIVALALGTQPEVLVQRLGFCETDALVFADVARRVAALPLGPRLRVLGCVILAYRMWLLAPDFVPAVPVSASDPPFVSPTGLWRDWGGTWSALTFEAAWLHIYAGRIVFSVKRPPWEKVLWDAANVSATRERSRSERVFGAETAPLAVFEAAVLRDMAYGITTGVAMSRLFGGAGLEQARLARLSQMQTICAPMGVPMVESGMVLLQSLTLSGTALLSRGLLKIHPKGALPNVHAQCARLLQSHMKYRVAGEAQWKRVARRVAEALRSDAIGTLFAVAAFVDAVWAERSIRAIGGSYMNVMDVLDVFHLRPDSQAIGSAVLSRILAALYPSGRMGLSDAALFAFAVRGVAVPIGEQGTLSGTAWTPDAIGAIDEAASHYGVLLTDAPGIAALAFVLALHVWEAGDHSFLVPEAAGSSIADAIFTLVRGKTGLPAADLACLSTYGALGRPTLVTVVAALLAAQVYSTTHGLAGAIASPMPFVHGASVSLYSGGSDNGDDTTRPRLPSIGRHAISNAELDTRHEEEARMERSANDTNEATVGHRASVQRGAPRIGTPELVERLSATNIAPVTFAQRRPVGNARYSASFSETATMGEQERPATSTLLSTIRQGRRLVEASGVRLLGSFRPLPPTDRADREVTQTEVFSRQARAVVNESPVVHATVLKPYAELFVERLLPQWTSLRRERVRILLSELGFNYGFAVRFGDVFLGQAIEVHRETVVQRLSECLSGQADVSVTPLQFLSSLLSSSLRGPSDP